MKLTVALHKQNMIKYTINAQTQRFLTFYDHRAPEFLNNLHKPLNYQTDLEKMPLIVNNFTFMTLMDPLYPNHGPPVKNLYTYKCLKISLRFIVALY